MTDQITIQQESIEQINQIYRDFLKEVRQIEKKRDDQIAKIYAMAEKRKIAQVRDQIKTT